MAKYERMTKYDIDGRAVMDCKKCKADWMGKYGKPMIECTALYCRNRLKDRLAAYEDTGLTPEQLRVVLDDSFCSQGERRTGNGKAVDEG